MKKYSDEEILLKAKEERVDKISMMELSDNQYEIKVKMGDNHFYTVTYRASIIDGVKMWDKGTVRHNS